MEKHEHLGKRVVLATLGAVALWDVLSPKGHTFSEGVDELIEKHPILTRAAIGYTALHLMNLLPEKLDLFHHLTKMKPKHE